MSDISATDILSPKIREHMAALEKALQDAIIWLSDKMEANRSDTDELVKFLEMQKVFMGSLDSSFTENSIGVPPSEGVQRLQRELLSVLRKSFDLTIKLAHQFLDEVKVKQSRIGELGNGKAHLSNAPEPALGEYDNEEPPEDPVDSENDGEQYITGEMVDIYADGSSVRPNPLDNIGTAHWSLLFHRARGVQGILEHFKEQMGLEMKEKVHELGMAIEWTQDYERMDLDEAERISREGYMEQTEAMDN